MRELIFGLIVYSWHLVIDFRVIDNKLWWIVVMLPLS